MTAPESTEATADAEAGDAAAGAVAAGPAVADASVDGAAVAVVHDDADTDAVPDGAAPVDADASGRDADAAVADGGTDAATTDRTMYAADSTAEVDAVTAAPAAAASSAVVTAVDGSTDTAVTDPPAGDAALGAASDVLLDDDTAQVAAAGTDGAAHGEPDALDILTPARPAAWADERSRATALTWVDPSAVAEHSSVAALDATEEVAPGASVLAGARLRSAAARPGVLVPLGVLAGLVAVYAGTTLLWPLHEVAPTVQAAELTTTAAPAAAITWPAQGTAAVGIDGFGSVSSSLDLGTIASITKVVSSLMVLDRMPLAVGEQGPEFSFTRADNLSYWTYRRENQSALDVPVGGVLTEYQLLQGTLIGSANNYIDRLAREIWGSDREFAAAAEEWLRERGIQGITIVTPSGFDEGNVATPDALVRLAELAMSNPVFAEIVGTESVMLPGAGLVENTNGMLADEGVTGIKTGTLGGWNLLTSKDVVVGDTTAELFAAVLGQDDDEQRLAATRSLFSQVEASLEAQEPAVPKGTVVGTVQTLWGPSIDIVTDADSDVVLWNGADAQATPSFALGENRAEGDEVGTLLTAGPLNTTEVPLVLAEEVAGPDPWWRLTHPLDLFGLSSPH